MTIKILKLIYRLTVPGAALLLLAAALVRLGAIPGPDNAVLRIFPYIVFGIGILLSIVFNRSRLFFALLILLLSESWIGIILPGLPASGANRIVFSAIALLLPLNLLALSLMRDRGIVSPVGRRLLIGLSVQIFAVGLLTMPGAARAARVLDFAFLPGQLAGWSRLPQPGLLAFAVACGALLTFLARRYDVVHNGLFWSAIAAFVALRLTAASYLAPLYFSAAGLILVISVLETSYYMAFQDDLTQLPSRRAFNQDMLKLGGHYTIAMVDVDHFKKFNDSFGHESGDQALRMVASKLARIAGGGKAYRYGGEEFAVLFPGKQPEEAFTYLDRMRRHIEQSTFIVRSLDRRKNGKRRLLRGPRKQTHVTVSIGVSACNGERAAPDEVLRVADQALYRAKQKGRNCTVAARPSRPSASVKNMTYGMKVVSVE